MTVSTTTSGVTRTGDGVTLEFSFSFEARLAAEIFVSEIVGLVLVAVDPADYVVAIEPDGVGGTVTFTVAPDDGANLYIFRETAQTQLVSVSNQTRYNPEVVEGVWDKHAFLIQELTELANRSVKTVPGGDPDALIETLETSAASAEASAASAEADAAAAAASAAAAALFDPGNLAGLLALTLSANKLAYPTGASSWALTDFTAAARALLDDADAAAMRTTLGLAIGTDVQARGATLTSLESLSLVAGDVLYATAADTLARLAKGAAGQVLRQNAGLTAPEWADPPGMALLGTLITTSGVLQTLSGLTLTSYKFLLFDANGVSHSNGAGQSYTVGGVAISENVASTGTVYGQVWVSLTTGRLSGGWAKDGAAVNNNSMVQGNTGYTTASTSVSVGVTAASFDAGSVLVYGVR